MQPIRLNIALGPLLPVPPVRGGGTERAWYNLALEFARRGHVVRVISRTFPGMPTNEERDGLAFTRVPGFNQSSSRLWDLARDLRYAARVASILEESDFTITFDFWTPLLLSRVPTWRRRAGRIVHLMGRYPKGQSWLYRGVDRVIAYSSEIERAIVEEDPTLQKRVRVIPLPVETRGVTHSGTPASGDDDPRILYVGRLHREKGVDLLVQAFGLLIARGVRATLDIVGPSKVDEGGSGNVYLAELQKLASSHPVTFHGPVFEDTALNALYRSATLFCYPSLADRGETLGVAPLEAMACGVPPVVSDLGCFRDFVIPGETGFVFHRSPEGEHAEALADVLESALRNRDQVAQIAQKTRLKVQEFSVEAVAERYLEEFQRMD